MSRIWVIVDEHGDLLEQVESETHPCEPPAPDLAPAYDVPLERVHLVDRRGDLEAEMFVPGAGWQPDLDGFRARALRLVDLRRSEVEQQLSPRLAHGRKRSELARLAAGADPDQLPWLSAEATARGEPIATTAERVAAQVRDTESTAAELEARLVAAKTAIRDAGSAEAIGAELRAVGIETAAP